MYRKIKDKHKHTHSRYAFKNRNKRVSHNNDIGCETFCDEAKRNEIVVYEDEELFQGKLKAFIQKQKHLHQEEIASKVTLIQSVEEKRRAKTNQERY